MRIHFFKLFIFFCVFDNVCCLGKISKFPVLDEFSINGLSVYPNPTQTELSISTKVSLGNATIKLTDLNGREVLNIERNLIDTISINTANLQDGIYILSISGENFNFVEKVIKN